MGVWCLWPIYIEFGTVNNIWFLCYTHCDICSQVAKLSKWHTSDGAMMVIAVADFSVNFLMLKMDFDWNAATFTVAVAISNAIIMAACARISTNVSSANCNHLICTLDKKNKNTQNHRHDEHKIKCTNKQTKIGMTKAQIHSGNAAVMFWFRATYKYEHVCIFANVNMKTSVNAFT